MNKFVCLIFLFCFLFCCNPKQAEVDRIFEDGVEVVLNQLEPNVIQGESTLLTLEEVSRIRIESDDLCKLGLKNIWHFEITSDGNLYITSSPPNTKLIFLFDQDGRFIKSFGKKDVKTGEYFGLLHLRTTINDEIVVVEGGTDNIVYFDKEGNVAKEIPRSAIQVIKTGIPNESPRNSQLMDVWPLQNGNYLIFRSLNYYTELDHYCPLTICDTHLKEFKELDNLKIPGFNSSKVKKVEGFFPRLAWSVSQKRIYAGNDQRGYEINVFDLEGQLIRKIRKEYRPIGITNSYKERIRTMFEDAPWKEKLYFPDNFPPHQYLFTDEEERLFVMTYERGNNGPGYVYDIFNSEGIFIGNTILKNFGMPTYANEGGNGPLEVKVRKDRLYCVEMNNSGHNELAVYKMRWEHLKIDTN